MHLIARCPRAALATLREAAALGVSCSRLEQKEGKVQPLMIGDTSHYVYYGHSPVLF